MSPLTVGVAMETAPGERRVAMVPQVVGRLVGSGLDVLVETGAGRGAWFPDGAYAEAGATVVARLDLFARADVVVSVSLPDPRTRALLRGGQTLVGLLAPLPRPQVMAQLAAVNPEFAQADAALVVGANDVTNPADHRGHA
ncbi:NAD(P)(+) transhydrogenase (Re/Si-specific) subunit beta [Frankia sp. BMG5.23]|uniref:NAD(P)(+) transhydrogenase (Re/Si-specific) subunit beta n=1 Tax=Frankia sp. BMG5.23 TaxID=683305 RepID=UPI0004612443|nr:NAD(P)(+) transhydrogenase (Re/Si-specific) subunit beta [Frankia sp. BMG5.23]KDA42177.1 hypothetical protein BMG523Draft_02995 [Frankia sp. BMG5.23]